MITQAGDDPKVAGLVYVAAYAPEVGQSANDASTPFGWTEGQKQIRVDGEKFATVTSEDMLEDIAQGLPMAERKLALAVQGQSYGPMFDEKLILLANKGVSRLLWSDDAAWRAAAACSKVMPCFSMMSTQSMGALITAV